MRGFPGGSRARLLPALILVAMAVAAVPLSGAIRGTAQADETKSWKDITLLYTSDIKGKIEPCG